MAAHDFDLFVIGGGSGGVRAARIAAGHGAKVAIAEESRFGGTCVIRGCVPKKLLVYASRFADDFEDAAGFGWDVGEPEFSWPRLIAAKDAETARLEGLYRKGLESAGVRAIAARAAIVGPNAVKLATGETLSAAHILIATGGKPNYDDALPGIEHVISSNEALDLDALPDRITVAGGGYIAVEFASIFAGLGVETTLIYRGDRVLRGFDDDLRSGLMDAMAKRGIRLVMNDVFTSIERTPSGLVGKTRGGHRLEASEILFAIGRSPNVAGLGLEGVGVATRPNGAIIVDDQSQTSAPSIYAVGDVTDRVNLTPVAIREGHAFADSRFGGKPWTVDYAMIPTAVFTTPEIGTVGLSEAAARSKFGAVDIYETRFRPMRNVLAGRDERTHMKLVVDAGTGRVAGCHILGPDAAEIVQMAAIAMKLGATKSDFDATVALHPSAAEELVTLRTKRS
ncbi:MAG: glutathione-disulfide reductase [Hyphomicrobium sp.]|nr:glutathione-disulfide reductase [Hyphomicrobium sp.]